MFGTKMEDLEIQGGRVTGVRVSKVDNTLHTFDLLEADAVVLGVGHSARDVYEKLLGHNVVLTPKPFAVSRLRERYQPKAFFLALFCSFLIIET